MAQSMLNSLNMAPSTHAKSKTWFQQPWLLEAADPKHWSYIPPTKPVSGDDGDAEVLRDSLVEAAEEDESGDGSYNDGLNLEAELVNDGLDPIAIAEDECRVVISKMLDSIEERPPNCIPGIPNTIPAVPVVEYIGKVIYKSTLVSELNGNPFLSKDRLTKIKNLVFFNNAEEYLSAANSSTTCLFALGSDCGVLFMKSSNLNISSIVRAAQKRKRGGGERLGRPAVFSGGVDVGSWWLG